MMTRDEKSAGYLKLCRELIDYIWTCADRGIRPLKHDANLYTVKLERIRNERVER